jgi:hypothetical protein
MADRYTMERKIGAGGMADVYLAHDVRHNRKVAIKVMHRELAMRVGVDRFLCDRGAIHARDEAPLNIAFPAVDPGHHTQSTQAAMEPAGGYGGIL